MKRRKLRKRRRTLPRGFVDSKRNSFRSKGENAERDELVEALPPFCTLVEGKRKFELVGEGVGMVMIDERSFVVVNFKDERKFGDEDEDDCCCERVFENIVEVEVEVESVSNCFQITRLDESQNEFFFSSSSPSSHVVAKRKKNAANVFFSSTLVCLFSCCCEEKAARRCDWPNVSTNRKERKCGFLSWRFPSISTSNFKFRNQKRKCSVAVFLEIRRNRRTR